MAAAATPMPVTGTGQVVTGPGVYQGCSIRNTSGGTATYQLYDNTSAAGTLVATFQLAAGASAVDNPATGVFFSKGLWLQAGAAVEGSVRV
jgi:hypothetical protein